MLAIMTTLEVLLAWTDDPQGSLRMAHREAETAVALDAMDAWAHGAICLCNVFTRQYESALAAGHRATELNPSLAAAHYFLGGALMLDGQPQEAIASMTKAVRISAKDPMLFGWLAGLGFAPRFRASPVARGQPLALPGVFLETMKIGRTLFLSLFWKHSRGEFALARRGGSALCPCIVCATFGGAQFG